MSVADEDQCRRFLYSFMKTFALDRGVSPVYASELAQRPLDVFNMYSQDISFQRFREILGDVCNQIVIDGMGKTA
jgi:hypothetical protein